MLVNTLKNAAARIMAVLAFISATCTNAAPTDHGNHRSLSVYIRNAAGSYAHSESMARDIERRGSDSSSLLERSGATVQACYTSSCTNCYVVWDGSFTSNSACLSASNTACLIISNLQDANVEFWNSKFCGSVAHGRKDDTATQTADPIDSLNYRSGLQWVQYRSQWMY